MTMISLYDAVLTLVRQLSPEDQRRLVAEVAQPLAVTNEDAPEITAETLITTPEIRAMVAKMRPEELIRPPQGTIEDAVAMLRSWNEEDAEGDDDEGESWDEVLRSIDANRSSYRRLFPDLDNK
jgi:hypothetical protein